MLVQSDVLDPQDQDDRDLSPEIPLQDTGLTISLPTPTSASSRKIKKRKTLESVLSTLLESKLGKNGIIGLDDGSDKEKPVTTAATTTKVQVLEVGGRKRDKSQDKTVSIRKRKTLVGKRARGKTEALKLSVVDDLVSK